MVDFTTKFSNITKELRGSAIRDLLKYGNRPGIISFGGGLPNPLSFPIEEIKAIINKLLEENGPQILQYGSTDGVAEFIDAISKRLEALENIKADKSNIMVFNGSQSGLYLLGKIFINPGDLIITEAPTYVGALSAFRSHSPRIISIEMDNEGMKTSDLEEVLKKTEIMPKFVYVIPNFQNPAGITMNLDRRKHLLELARDYDLVIIEDDPYGQLRFSGSKIPTITAMDREHRTIYLGTFSKILAPGLRLGYTVAEAPVIQKLNLAKQATELCTNTFSQYIAAEYIKNGYIERQIPKIIKMYSEKKDIMIKVLEEFMPPGTEWTNPQGGMFLWAKVDPRIDTQKMLPRAIENGVAYVIGSAFYPTEDGKNAMRLNFTYPSNEAIREGIIKLSKVVREELSLSVKIQ